MQRIVSGLLVASAVAACLIRIGAANQQAGNALTWSEFEKLHGELQPRPEETWRSIPWKASLLEAQAMAAREQKPMFIWAMDGNPLGCG